MLEIMEKQNQQNLDGARTASSGVKSIFVLHDSNDLQNAIGYVYAVSTEKDSYKELCELDSNLRNKGLQTIIIGNYENNDLL